MGNKYRDISKILSMCVFGPPRQWYIVLILYLYYTYVLGVNQEK